MSFKRMLKTKTKKMQYYLKSSEIPVNEAQNLFKYRVRVAHLKENFGDKYENKACPLCSVNLDTQVHSVQCEKVKEKVTIDGKYNDIFKEKNTKKHLKNSLQNFKAEGRPLVKKNHCLYQLWRP